MKNQSIFLFLLLNIIVLLNSCEINKSLTSDRISYPLIYSSDIKKRDIINSQDYRIYIVFMSKNSVSLFRGDENQRKEIKRNPIKFCKDSISYNIIEDSYYIFKIKQPNQTVYEFIIDKKLKSAINVNTSIFDLNNNQIDGYNETYYILK